MNLVQISEQAKNLSNDQLQKMLQAPDGVIPPFILASEAARRQSMETSMQAQQKPQDSTVLDDLIQKRASAAGVSTLPGQMAAGAPPAAGIDQLQQAQPAEPVQARDGGIMRLAGGGFPQPKGNNSSQSGMSDSTYDYLFFGDPNDPRTQARKPSATAPDLSNGEIDGMTPSGGLPAGERLNLTKQISQQAAAAKEAESAAAKDAMGDDQADVPPTTDNKYDYQDYTDRINGLYKNNEDGYMLGISPGGYADVAEQFQATTPGLTDAQRWAGAAKALAGDRRTTMDAESANSREGAMALLKYNMATDERDHQDWASERDYRRSQESTAADHQVAGIKQQVESAKYRIDDIGAQIKTITAPFEQQGAPLDEATQKRVDDLDEQRRQVMALYTHYNDLISQANGVDPRLLVQEETGPDGRPRKIGS